MTTERAPWFAVRRFVALVRRCLFGDERLVAYRLLKHEYWFGGYYDFNTESPNTTFTRTFRNKPLSATDVPNPFFWPGLAEEVRRTLAAENSQSESD